MEFREKLMDRIKNLRFKRVSNTMYSRIGNRNRVNIQADRAIGYNKALDDVLKMIDSVKENKYIDHYTFREIKNEINR